jgi:hypothetical protein
MNLRKLPFVFGSDIGWFFTLEQPAVEGGGYHWQQMLTTSDAEHS